MPTPLGSELIDDYASDATTTGAVSVGGSVTGQIEVAYDVDWFRVTLQAGRLYAFDLTATDPSFSGVSPSFILYDGSVRFVAQAENSHSSATRVFSPTTDAAYYVAAKGDFATTGGYVLSVTDQGADDSLGSSATTAVVAVGGSVTGDIQFLGDQDWFRIGLNEGAIYSFELKGAESDGGTLGTPVLKLLNASNEVVATDTGGWTTGDSARFSVSNVPAGSYFLSAEGNWIGTYTLVTTLLGVDDYAASSATTGSLAAGGAATGNIQFGGDADWFKVEVIAGQVYAFDLKTAVTGNGTLTQARLTLLDATGNVRIDSTAGLSGMDPHIAAGFDASGTYYLSASAFNQAVGSYRLESAVIGTDDFAASVATTGALEAGGTVSGEIQYQGDADWLRIDLLAGHYYAIDMLGASAGGGTLPAPVIQLRDSTGVTANLAADAGVVPGVHRTFLAPSSGIYYLEASATGAATGSYTLKASDLGVDDYLGSTATTASLALGDMVSGEVQGAYDQDWFRIQLTADRTYAFDLLGFDLGQGALANTRLQMLDANGSSLLFGNSATTPGDHARLAFLAPYSGIYYLSAQGQYAGESGGYILTGEDSGLDDHIQGTATTSILPVGASVSGSIQYFRDQDWYRVDLVQDTTYVFSMRGFGSAGNALGDPGLRLLDANGWELATDADFNTGKAGIAFTAPQSGVYFVSAEGSSAYEAGDYVLTLSTDDYPQSTSTGGSLTLGATANGDIQFTGDHDWFRVELTKGIDYVFDLKGADAGGGTLEHGYAVLRDSFGNTASGNFTHVLFRPANTGTYFVDVQTIVGTGTYTLELTPDDYAGSTLTSGVLAPGGSVKGSVDAADDQDWFKITLTTGHSYAFTLEGQDSGGGSLVDPLLRLLDGAGNGIIADHDSGVGRDARLIFTAATSGTYYLSAEQPAYLGGQGTYTLSARDLGSGHTAAPVSNAVALSGSAVLDGLIQGGAWQFSGPHVLTYSFNQVADNGQALGGVWSDREMNAVREALLAWEAVANLSFVEIPGSTNIEENTADIALANVGSYLYPVTALGIFPSPTYVNQLLTDLGLNRALYPRAEGDVLLDESSVDMQYLSPGASGYWVVLHELGHALGLKHPFDDGGNGRPTFSEQGIADKDVSEQTTMSYHIPVADHSIGYAATPMPLDIQAIQRIYGANTTYHNTDNTYYVTADGALRTLWDTGGVDWLDASGLNFDVQLSLSAGSVNKILSASAIAIAYGVEIENARGGGGADTLVGTSGANILEGGANDDTLDGGAGTDRLFGGTGNDVYIVDSANDRVVEYVDEGWDSVRSSVSWTLGRNCEDLTLIGGLGINATGNGQDNTLTGNDGGNILDGGAGADVLIGGPGNDTYVVDNANDAIQEAQSGSTQIDTVRSWVDWTLGVNLENLTLIGVKDLGGTGNALDNTLIGNGGNNTLNGGGGNDFLDGGSGNDTLIGGAGNDVFFFSHALNGTRNVDIIADFTSGADKIHLSKAIFGEIGFSSTPTTGAFFHAGSAAHDADDRILYDQATGNLAYDADGTGPLAAMRFALLDGAPALQYTDFVVV